MSTVPIVIASSSSNHPPRAEGCLPQIASYNSGRQIIESDDLSYPTVIEYVIQVRFKFRWPVKNTPDISLKIAHLLY